MHAECDIVLPILSVCLSVCLANAGTVSKRMDMHVSSHFFNILCPVQAPGCKNRPAPFPGRMSYWYQRADERIQEPSVVRDRDGTPQVEPLAVHCFCV